MPLHYRPMPGHIVAFQDPRCPARRWRLGMAAKVDDRGRITALIPSGEKSALSTASHPDMVKTIPESAIRNLAARLANREAVGAAWDDVEALKAAIMALA